MLSTTRLLISGGHIGREPSSISANLVDHRGRAWTHKLQSHFDIFGVRGKPMSLTNKPNKIFLLLTRIYVEDFSI